MQARKEKITVLETLAVIVLLLTIPFAIWKRTGEFPVITLVTSVVILLKPRYSKLLFSKSVLKFPKSHKAHPERRAAAGRASRRCDGVARP